MYLSLFPLSISLSRKYSDLRVSRTPDISRSRETRTALVGADLELLSISVPSRRRCAAADDGADVGARPHRRPGRVPATRSLLSKWKCIA